MFSTGFAGFEGILFSRRTCRRQSAGSPSSFSGSHRADRLSYPGGKVLTEERVKIKLFRGVELNLPLVPPGGGKLSGRDLFTDGGIHHIIDTDPSGETHFGAIGYFCREHVAESLPEYPLFDGKRFHSRFLSTFMCNGLFSLKATTAESRKGIR